MGSLADTHALVLPLPGVPPYQIVPDVCSVGRLFAPDLFDLLDCALLGDVDDERKAGFIGTREE